MNQLLQLYYRVFAGFRTFGGSFSVVSTPQIARVESFGSDFFDSSLAQELAQAAKTNLHNKNDQNPKRERASASILRIRGELPAAPQDPFSREKSISTGVTKPWMGRRFCHRDFVAKFPLRPELTAGPQDRRRWSKSFPYADIFAQILPLCAHFRQNPSLTRHFFPHNFRKWLKSFPYAHIFG